MKDLGDTLATGQKKQAPLLEMSCDNNFTSNYLVFLLVFLSGTFTTK